MSLKANPNFLIIFNFSVLSNDLLKHNLLYGNNKQNIVNKISLNQLYFQINEDLIETNFIGLKRPLLIFFSHTNNSKQPKAVQLTNEMIIKNLCQINSDIFGKKVSFEDNILLPISIQYIFGFYSFYYSLINGASLFCMGKFSIKKIFDYIPNYKV